MARLTARVLACLTLALLLSSCSSDPNQRKLSYLKSGQHYFNQKKFQEAVIEFRNAIQIDPRFAEAHYQLARSYQSLKNYNAAYRELLDTVTLAPENSLPLYSSLTSSSNRPPR